MKIKEILAIAGASFIVVALIIAEVVLIIDLTTATPNTHSPWFWWVCIIVGIPSVTYFLWQALIVLFEIIKGGRTR